MVVDQCFQDLVLESMLDLVSLARDGYCLGTAGSSVFLDDALDEVVFKVFCGGKQVTSAWICLRKAQSGTDLWLRVAPYFIFTLYECIYGLGSESSIVSSLGVGERSGWTRMTVTASKRMPNVQGKVITEYGKMDTSSGRTIVQLH
jgi:hypothetical protein